jgi:hypothetical protein
MLDQPIRKMLLLLVIPATCCHYGCTVFSSKGPSRLNQSISYPSYIEDTIDVFQRSGKDRKELVRIARALMVKVGQPPENAQRCWAFEVPRTELNSLLNYLTGVWSIRKVAIGGNDECRFLELYFADRPVGVWIYEKDIVTVVNARESGYEDVKSWGSAMVIVCDLRKYGEGTITGPWFMRGRKGLN